METHTMRKRTLKGVTKREALAMLKFLQPQLFSKTAKTKDPNLWKFEPYEDGKRLLFNGNDYFLDIDYQAQNIGAGNSFIGDYVGMIPVSIQDSHSITTYLNNRGIYFDWQK